MKTINLLICAVTLLIINFSAMAQTSPTTSTPAAYTITTYWISEVGEVGTVETVPDFTHGQINLARIDKAPPKITAAIWELYMNPSKNSSFYREEDTGIAYYIMRDRADYSRKRFFVKEVITYFGDIRLEIPTRSRP